MASFITLHDNSNESITVNVDSIITMRPILGNLVMIKLPHDNEIYVQETIEDIIFMKNSPIHCK